MSVLMKVLTVGGLLGNCLVTGLLLLISHHNYPGGVALQRLHILLQNQTGGTNVVSCLNSLYHLNIHICVISACGTTSQEYLMGPLD